MITHTSLKHNLDLIIDDLKADETTINVSWLPQYHDMGLIGELPRYFKMWRPRHYPVLSGSSQGLHHGWKLYRRSGHARRRRILCARRDAEAALAKVGSVLP